MSEQYNFVTIGDNYIFDKDPSDIDKYVVMTCAKNEEDYIVEWIEHYLGLGFDKLFIVDNNDVGNDGLINKIQGYVDRGVVQVFDCRGHYSVQVGIYGVRSMIAMNFLISVLILTLNHILLSRALMA